MSSLALARLRQGQARCTQQLMSLLQWHQQQSAAAAAGGAVRGLADQPAAVQFAKERKGFENSLGELRKQWAKEREEREAAKAAAAEAARCAAAAAAATAKAITGPGLSHGRHHVALVVSQCILTLSCPTSSRRWLLGGTRMPPAPIQTRAFPVGPARPPRRAAREAARARRAQSDLQAKARRLAEYQERVAAERELRVGGGGRVLLPWLARRTVHGHTRTARQIASALLCAAAASGLCVLSGMGVHRAASMGQNGRGRWRAVSVPVLSCSCRRPSAAPSLPAAALQQLAAKAERLKRAGLRAEVRRLCTPDPCCAAPAAALPSLVCQGSQPRICCLPFQPQVLDVARSERRSQLLLQSTNWVTPQARGWARGAAGADA